MVNIVSFTAVVVRFLAALIFLYVLRETTRIISLASHLDSYQQWPIAALFIIGFFMFGMLLWSIPIAIAKKIVPKGVSFEDVPPNDFHRPIYQLVFVLLGMYVFIYGVSEFSYTAQLYFSLPDNSMVPGQIIRQKASMISSAIEVFFGLILVIGSRGVSEVVQKIRYGSQ